jgi:hypothetical protein
MQATLMIGHQSSHIICTLPTSEIKFMIDFLQILYFYVFSQQGTYPSVDGIMQILEPK